MIQTLLLLLLGYWLVRLAFSQARLGRFAPTRPTLALAAGERERLGPELTGLVERARGLVHRCRELRQYLESYARELSTDPFYVHGRGIDEKTLLALQLPLAELRTDLARWIADLQAARDRPGVVTAGADLIERGPAAITEPLRIEARTLRFADWPEPFASLSQALEKIAHRLARCVDDLIAQTDHGYR